MADDRKEAIKAKLTANRDALLATVGNLTAAQWGTQAYSEGSEWAVIDILRHVADSERGMTSLMIQIKGGGEGVREVRAHTRAAPRDQRSSPVQHCGRHARIVSCARCARRIACSWPGR